MAYDSATNYEVLEGVVAMSNDRGIKLRGEDGWINISKYADGDDISPCSQGDTVELEIDNAGYIRSLTVRQKAERQKAERQQQRQRSPRQGGSQARSAPAQRQSAPSHNDDARQRLIVRQSALKAAVDIYGPMPVGTLVRDYQGCIMEAAEVFVDWVFEKNEIFCEECGQALAPQPFNDGTTWDIKRLLSEGQDRFSQTLCYPDFKQAYMAQQRQDAEKQRATQAPAQDSDLEDLPF